MKAQVYKIKFILVYIIKKLIFSWQIDTAYIGNMVGNLISTFIYNIIYVLFLTVLLKEVKTFAGYSFNDMLVFTFVSQCVFYTAGTFSNPSATDFSKYVKNGDFDMILIKPISAFLQVMTLRISPFVAVVNAIPSLSIYLILIVKNNAFNPTGKGLAIGVSALLIGLIFMHFYRFAVVMTVFKMRQNKSLVKTVDIVSRIGDFPYEAYSNILRIIISFLTPLFLASAVPTLYILNKTASLTPLFTLIAFTLLSIFLTLIQWRKGLRLYESASS